MSIGLRETVKTIRAAYPGNEEVVKDVVHVEIWDYSMRRFAEGASATDIFSEVNNDLQTKNVKGLVAVIQRARDEWQDVLTGARVVRI